MEENTSRGLVPVREETVNFYGDELAAAQMEDGTIMVPLRPIAEALGLTWPSQTQRVRRDPVLSPLQGVIMMKTPGGEQGFLALPLKVLPGWLFGIDSRRVRPELREKILRYQQDCYEVLWQHFKGQIMPEAPQVQASGAQRALQIAEAVYEIARQQVELERRNDTMADYMRGHVRKVNSELAEHDQRLSALELQVGGAGLISDSQALEIAGAVKAVAHALSEKGEKSAYQRVYGELYRRFNVSGYKNLPTARYEEAMAWLKGWHEEITGNTG